MLIISFLFIIIFLFNSLILINSNIYDWDLDQFMYSGSRFLEGELAWTKEFDDKSPLQQFIFAIPAFFKDLDVWIIISFILSLIGAYCVFSITRIILENIFKEKNKNVIYISILSSSIFLLLLTLIKGSIVQINAFCTNLIILSMYFLLKSTFNNTKKKVFFIIGAFFASVCISIRPYFIFAALSIGVWISFRSYLFENEKYKKKLKKIIIISSSWIFTIGFFIALINFLPYLITNNLEIFISTIKINSVEYVSNPFQTLESQLFFLKTNPIVSFSYSFFIFLFLLIHVRRKFIKREFLSNNLALMKFETDSIFIGIIFPLLIELTILSRHFFFHYMSFFAGYASICIGLFIGLLMQVFNNKKIKILNFIIIFSIVFLVSKNINYPKSFTNNLDQIRDNDFPIIEKFIKKEKHLNENINFLFPLNNYFHWKLSESRHGFPLAAVYRNISQGKLDAILEKMPNLKFNYVMTKSNELCSALIEMGPDLIFTKYKDKDGTFTYDCLQQSNEYILEKSDSSLKDIEWFVFRSNKLNN